MLSLKSLFENLLILLFMTTALAGNASAYQDAGGKPLSMAALPPAAQMAVNATLGRDDGRYQIARGRGANPGQGLKLDFNGAGVKVTADGTSLGMTLSALRFGDTEAPLSVAAPVTEANRVEYRRGPVTEWYLNGPLGLEQGFTVKRPASGSSDRLILLLDLRGELRGVADNDQTGVTLHRADGAAALRYGGLQAWDATGRSLAARMELVPGAEGSQRLALRVDTVGAAWPVTVDPFVQQAKLNGVQGMSVALSSDGNTALVGAPLEQVGANGYQGAAYVFTRSGGIWSQQARITDANGATADNLGYAVSLSSDGNTALIGIPGKVRAPDFFGNNGSIGAVFIYTRSGTIWSQEAQITPSDGVGGDNFGWSVAMSSNGGVALIGAPYKVIAGRKNQGAAYVFTRSGTTWSQMTRLSAVDGAANDLFGKSVALSSDGTTLLIGANGKDINNLNTQGAAYVFTGAGMIWSQQARLSHVVSTSFGVTVSLSGDGNVALVGAPYTDMNNKYQLGTAYVFTRTGAVWGPPVILSAGDGTAQDRYGNAVSLSSDGTTALIAASFQSAARPGAVYLYTRSGLVWNQVAKQTASDGAVYDQFGIAVALSSDSSTALIGSLNMSWGAYVFLNQADTTTSLALTGGTNPATEGDLLTFTATVSGAPPSGTITLLDGAVTLASGPLISGTATFGINSLLASVAPHAITALYSGDPTHQGSTSAVLNMSVQQKKYHVVMYVVPGTGHLLATMPGGGVLGGDVYETYVPFGGSTDPVTPVPSIYSHFVNWTEGSGLLTSTDNPLTVTNVTADMSIKANFSPLPPVRAEVVPLWYYSSLQAAYDGNVPLAQIPILAQTFTFKENLNLSAGVQFTITGGYATDYLTQTGFTVLQGTVTVSQGCLVVDRLIVQ